MNTRISFLSHKEHIEFQPGCVDWRGYRKVGVHTMMTNGIT